MVSRSGQTITTSHTRANVSLSGTIGSTSQGKDAWVACDSSLLYSPVSSGPAACRELAPASKLLVGGMQQGRRRRGCGGRGEPAGSKRRHANKRTTRSTRMLSVCRLARPPVVWLVWQSQPKFSLESLSFLVPHARTTLSYLVPSHVFLLVLRDQASQFHALLRRVVRPLISLPSSWNMEWNARA